MGEKKRGETFEFLGATNEVSECTTSQQSPEEKKREENQPFQMINMKKLNNTTP